MNVVGIQLMIELKECNPELLDDLPYIKAAMTQAAEEVGAHIIGRVLPPVSHPRGVTGILAIAESHICIHTWPEHGYAAAGHLYVWQRPFLTPQGRSAPHREA